MTNEEIRCVAEDAGLGVPENIDKLERDIRSLVSQAYEEAARTHCWSCRDGETPTLDTGRGVHIHTGGAHCKASEIHRLKDALARQAVLTS